MWYWLAWIVGFVIFFAIIDYSTNANSYGTGVHITGVTYHYYNPDNGATLTYSVPEIFNMGVGSKINYTEPLTDNLTCSMTMLQAYATTPGFNFSLISSPATIQPGQSSSVTMIITAPSYTYSGPLNVNVTVTYGSGC